MTTPALLSQADVELRMGGARYLVQLTDDDGDGTADASIVAGILDEASRLAEGLLWDGFPTREIIASLAGDDVAVRGAIADIACGLAGQRRPEFQNAAGEPVHQWRRKQGERVLKEIAQAAGRRASGEETAGRNRILRVRTNRSISDTPFVFPRSSKDTKGPGGFAWSELVAEETSETILSPVSRYLSHGRILAHRGTK